jgi:nucleotide-binding universal stress UspA family protein
LRAGGGALELLHVREQHLPTPTYETPPVPLSPGQRAELEAQLLALAPAEAATLRIAVTPIVVDGGAPAETILQTARRLGVDAIAMSSHGRGGVRRALLGSVTEAVVRASDKPVYVVRSPGK